MQELGAENIDKITKKSVSTLLKRLKIITGRNRRTIVRRLLVIRIKVRIKIERREKIIITINARENTLIT